MPAPVRGLQRDRYFEAGLRLKVYRPSGELVLGWVLPKLMNAEHLRLAVLYRVAAQERIPRCCVAIVWGQPGIYQQGEITAQFVTTTLTQEESNKWAEYSDESHDEHGLPLCMVCYDPCHDADHPFAPRTREDNCIMCTPCFLCEECTVQGLQGRLCLLCVQDFPNEMAHLPADAMTRLRMVDEQVRNATPDKLLSS